MTHEEPNKPTDDLIDRVAPKHAKTPARWQQRIARYWKALIALGGFAFILLNTLVGLQFFSERTLDWINTAIAALVTLGVFVKTNQAKVEKLTGIDIDEDNMPG